MGRAAVILLSVGQVFGKLTVTELDLRLAPSPIRSDGRKRIGERAVRVRCSCGNEFVTKITNLVSPKSEIVACKICSHTPEGLALQPLESYLYNHWNNLRHKQLCSSWLTYEKFRDDIPRLLGDRPPQARLARKNPKKDYSPGNVRWIE